MEKFFSKNAGRFLEYQNKYLGDRSSPLADACNAAINLVFSEIGRYDYECTFMPEYSGEMALRALEVSAGDLSMTRILYFLTGCVREVTMTSSTVRGFERDVLDRFRSEAIATNPKWDGWHGHYSDWIFNILPFRKASGVISELSEVRSEVEAAGVKIKEESASMAALANDLRSEMKTAYGEERQSMLEELASLEKRISGYRAELEKHAKSYNFVSLSEAFKQLIGAKSDEVERYAIGIGVAGFFALAAPLAAALLIQGGTWGWAQSQGWSAFVVMKFAGLIGVELVLLYYFRIALKSFLLAKNQQANLSLRLALCQFIEGYCDFAGRAKEKGVPVMKGFEDLIFSPLPANDSALPPTVDGVDGIVKIAAALRSTKP